MIIYISTGSVVENHGMPKKDFPETQTLTMT